MAPTPQQRSRTPRIARVLLACRLVYDLLDLFHHATATGTHNMPLLLHVTDSPIVIVTLCSIAPLTTTVHNNILFWLAVLLPSVIPYYLPFGCNTVCPAL